MFDIVSCDCRRPARLRGSVLLQSMIAKIAMAGALHDGLCARELDVGIKSLGRVEVRAADQQEAKLGLTEFLVEFGKFASRNIDLERILRLLDHTVIESVIAGIGGECG